jgi:hypothetical protein
VGVVVQRGDRRVTVIKGNDDDDRWSSDGVMLWLVRRQNSDVVEW